MPSISKKCMGTFTPPKSMPLSPGSDLDDIDEKYLSLGDFQVVDGAIVMDPPDGSVTTFYAK
jgi:hypothetical protein